MTIHEEETHFQDSELIQVAKNLELQKDIKNYTSLRIGDLFLDKYRIVKVLGRGNSSIIYLLVSNDDSQKLFVLKEFFPKGFVERNKKEAIIVKPTLTKAELKNYHLMQEIFIGEAQNLMRASNPKHPNVIHFLTFKKNINNTHYYIMEYEEGHSLKTYIENLKKSGVDKLSNKEIISLAKKLLDGLHHIHTAGVYHQDIKLENILIRKDNSPIIIDFGASVLVHDKENRKYYNTATLKYAAPEQITMDSPPKINETTDIYNMGVLLYKLITGTFPPKADERSKSLARGKDSYVPLVEQNLPHYDHSLLKAVDTSLNLVQDKRFQNAIEFKEALSKYHLKTSYIVAFALPLLFALVYFIWPNNQEHIQNIQKTKQTTLPHTHVATQNNVLRHKVTIISDIDNVKYLINEKPIKDNAFFAEKGKNYTILSMSDGYEPQEYTVDYNTLSDNNFVFETHMLNKKELALETGTDLSAYVEEDNIAPIDLPQKEDNEIAQPLPKEEDSLSDMPVLPTEEETPKFIVPKPIDPPIVKKSTETKTPKVVKKTHKRIVVNRKKSLRKKEKERKKRIAQEKEKATKKRLALQKKRDLKRKLALKKRRIAKRRLALKRKKSMATESVWYCVARSRKIIKSAKKPTKSAAKATALWGCNKYSKGQICRVSCYLWK